jgi:hypothetical protein
VSIKKIYVRGKSSYQWKKETISEEKVCIVDENVTNSEK